MTIRSILRVLTAAIGGQGLFETSLRFEHCVDNLPHRPLAAGSRCRPIRGGLCARIGIRNGEEWKRISCRSDEYSDTVEDATELSRFAIQDDEGNPFAYYYVRVLQDDGEMAWSSPVWIT